MCKMAIFAMLVMVGGSAAHAQSQFEPRTMKGPHSGQPNQVMVLGSAHLSSLPESFQPATLDPLIARLRDWKPQAIAVEALSGAQCDYMRHYPDRYSDTVEEYCWDPAPARAATGLDVPAANQAAERMLADWSSQPTPSQRRHLAAVFLAAGEQASALVQWLRLDDSERRSGDGLDAALVERLEKLRIRRNETMIVAAPLAAQLGLERVYAIDDHTADSVVADEKAAGTAIQRAWDNPATAQRKAMDDVLEKNLNSGAGVLAMYRAYNAPGSGKLVFDSDFGAALEEPSPQKFGRGYLGYWETRNLRMAANIRDMFAPRPGIRALVIVGASHKPYLDAYLDNMHDMRIIDTKTVLN